MTKKKKIIIILSILAFFLISAISIWGFIFYKNNYPKVESISLDVDNLELYVDESYKLELSINPSNAKNQDVEWSISNKNVLSLSNNTVVALKEGTGKICAKLKSDSEIIDCVDINVLSKKKKFQKHLVENCGCIETGEEKFECGTSDLKIEFDFYAGTYIEKYDSLKYVYHYGSGYVEGFYKDGKYEVKYLYRLDTKKLSCVGNEPYFHSLVCNYSGIQSTTNSIESFLDAFDYFLGDDYEIEDLY